MGVDEIAAELYALPPDEFTRARDAVARAATDSATSKAVKALRKPTAAAHAVNVVVRERPDEIDELLAVGESLRAAMSRGGGADVRQLTEARRALIADLVDPDLPAAVRTDVTATLEAATADPDLGAAVRTGRLLKPLRYAGFGALPDLDAALATPLRSAETASARPAESANARSAESANARPAESASVRTAGTPTAGARRRPAKRPTDAPQGDAPSARRASSRSASRATSANAVRAAKPVPSAADLDAARQRVLDLAGAADDAQRRYEAAARAATEARALLERAEDERADAHRAARAAHAAAEKARRELGRLERT